MKTNIFAPLDGSNMRIAIVASRFNQELCDALVEDACAALAFVHVPSDRVHIVRVPGSFELPIVTQGIAKTRRYDAIICLGVLIKGDTKHDQYIATAVTQGLMRIAITTGVPVAFGVLTVETQAQAEARAFGRRKKGWEAAMSAVETVSVLFSHKEPSSRGE